MSKVKVRVLLEPGGWLEDKVDKQYANIQEFVWTEGNFACDCNRQIFLDRRDGAEKDWIPDDGLPRDTDPYPCGHKIELKELHVGNKCLIKEGKYTDE